MPILRHHARMRFAHGSKSRLTTKDLDRFTGDRLFDRIARAVCRAGCLPRKELYEAWEVARRVRRRFRGGRVVDLCAGHGLLAHIMLLLDDTSPSALAVDPVPPLSGARLHSALIEAWPRLAGRVTTVAGAIEDIELIDTDVVVSSHACGALTDRVLAHAAATRARVAVLPCCHDVETGDAGGLQGWFDGPSAIDAVRALRLRAAGYDIQTQQIPANITPMNRLLLGASARKAEPMNDGQATK